MTNVQTILPFNINDFVFLKKYYGLDVSVIMCAAYYLAKLIFFPHFNTAPIQASHTSSSLNCFFKKYSGTPFNLLYTRHISGTGP